MTNKLLDPLTELPLFPLKTVLLPGNTLSLKIFEPRYIDMIATCMRTETSFGVILIYKGEETQSDNEIHSVGTAARVFDWQPRNDGLLGITALGMQRFEVTDTSTQSDGLTIAKVSLLEEEIDREIPEQYTYMEELLDHISAQEAKVRDPDESFATILYQLIFLLPLDANLKQRLLEIPKSMDRAVILHAELIRLGIIQYLKPTTTE
ncbi:MAG: Lon protease-like protein [Gammaproteobacteria bacterium]|jgi:Lon protease-like protein